MPKRFFTLALEAAIAVGVTVCPSAAASPETLEVTAVRFWSLPDATRIAVQTSGEFQFVSSRLDNPPRLVFDLPNARSLVGEKGYLSIPVEDGLVSRIRIAQWQRRTVRVVLDLVSPAEFVASQLANPERLMIEVRGGAAPGAGSPASVAAPASPAPLPPPVTRAPAPVERKAPEPAPVSRPSLSESSREAAQKPGPPAERAVPATENRGGGHSMTRVLGLKLGRVVLDPGHGGHDTGTIGKGGLREKDLVLDIARRLGALIEERMGSEVVYTRSEDTFVALEERTQIANSQKADLFLSIHANSSRLRSASGSETFYLDFTSDEADLEVAARENAGSQQSIFGLKGLLEKIALTDKGIESRELASRVQSALYSAYWRKVGSGRNRGVKRAPFVVLIGASMPSILIEIGFISNPREELLLKRADHRQRIAEALFQGLSNYASTLSHFQVAKGRQP